MKNREFTRAISIGFAIVFFLFAIAISVAMARVMIGGGEGEQSAFLKWMNAVLNTYKFSSILLPLSTLYAAITLIIPGWSRHSRAILLSFPLIFVTCAIGEYAISTFIPQIQNPTIASFAKWGVVLLTALIVCAISLLSHILSDKLVASTTHVTVIADVDIVGEDYVGGETDNLQHKLNSEKEEERETFFSLFKVEEHKNDSPPIFIPSIKETSIWQDDEQEEQTDTSYSKAVYKHAENGSAIQNKNTVQADTTTVATDSKIIQNEPIHNDMSQEATQEIVQTSHVRLAPESTQEVIPHVENVQEAINPLQPQTIENQATGTNEVLQTSTFKIEEQQADPQVMTKETLEALSPLNSTIHETVMQENENYTEEKKEAEREEIIKETKQPSSPPQEVKSLQTTVEEIEKEASQQQDIAEDIEKQEMEEINKLEVLSVAPEAVQQVEVPEAKNGYHISYDLLTSYVGNEYWVIDSSTRKAAFALKSTLNEFKINVEITGIRKGPVVTMFEVLPPPGIKLAKITALQDNIALRLAAESVRIVAPIPGKRAVGIEIPNVQRSIVGFRELIQAEHKNKEKMAIPIVLGKDITGEPEMIDLAQTPHLLIAGSTGAGKSVCVNSIILSILYNNRPDQVKLMLVDPKIVELKLYNDIAHLLTPVITDPKKAFQALQYCICEMERRYSFLDRISVRDIKSYNKKVKAEGLAMERLPYIVIIIDEFADLMATTGKELEGTVSRLCAMSRAVGIHLVLATQRPSADVITGLIKANIPSRIAFMVASRIDSRIILDDGGAEKLLGKGDMLYVSPAKPWPTRIQGAFVSEEEVVRVVEAVKTFGEPDYIDDEIFMEGEEESIDSVFGDESDPLYDEALDIVLNEGKASASYIQRRLKIGYNRAARIIEEMEMRGVVGPANGAKPRDILQQF